MRRQMLRFIVFDTIDRLHFPVVGRFIPVSFWAWTFGQTEDAIAAIDSHINHEPLAEPTNRPAQ